MTTIFNMVFAANGYKPARFRGFTEGLTTRTKNGPMVYNSRGQLWRAYNPGTSSYDFANPNRITQNGTTAKRAIHSYQMPEGFIMVNYDNTIYYESSVAILKDITTGQFLTGAQTVNLNGEKAIQAWGHEQWLMWMDQNRALRQAGQVYGPISSGPQWQPTGYSNPILTNIDKVWVVQDGFFFTKLDQPTKLYAIGAINTGVYGASYDTPFEINTVGKVKTVSMDRQGGAFIVLLEDGNLYAISSGSNQYSLGTAGYGVQYNMTQIMTGVKKAMMNYCSSSLNGNTAILKNTGELVFSGGNAGGIVSNAPYGTVGADVPGWVTVDTNVEDFDLEGLGMTYLKGDGSLKYVGSFASTAVAGDSTPKTMNNAFL